jgi:thiol-disulfide isomerase/thioredoxin
LLVVAVAAMALVACTPGPSLVRAGSSPSALVGASSSMPDLTLPSLTGGAPVALARLGRPAVLNLWASWCGPCRTELPEFQRLADASGDRLLVLGVVTGDSKDAASSLAADLGIAFPAVFDPDAKLQRSVAPSVLPATVFVDAHGTIQYVHATSVLNLSTLESLVRDHLGVTVG